MARETFRKKALGEVPPQRAAATAPAVRSVARAPRGDAMASAPLAHVSRAPAEHSVPAPPNPRKPKLVRDVHGGALKDLFELFPDLPRPAHPPARVPLRARRRH
jgi:hypothetical protein